MILEYISPKRYNFNISGITLDCITDTPVVPTVLKGIIEWYRKQSCAIYFYNRDGSYILILTYSNAYVIQEGIWQKLLVVNKTPAEIIKNLTADIANNISLWGGTEHKTKKDSDEDIHAIEDYLKIIDTYSKVSTSEYMDWTKYEKAEREYADYIKNNPYVK